MFETVESKIKDLKVGETYPFYGAITAIDESADMVVATINNNLQLNMIIPDPDRREVLKSRAFEPGIFVSRVTRIKDNGVVLADCQTVVFGRRGAEQ